MSDQTDVGGAPQGQGADVSPQVEPAPTTEEQPLTLEALRAELKEEVKREVQSQRDKRYAKVLKDVEHFQKTAQAAGVSINQEQLNRVQANALMELGNQEEDAAGGGPPSSQPPPSRPQTQGQYPAHFAAVDAIVEANNLHEDQEAPEMKAIEEAHKLVDPSKPETIRAWIATATQQASNYSQRKAAEREPAAPGARLPVGSGGASAPAGNPLQEVTDSSELFEIYKRQRSEGR